MSIRDKLTVSYPYELNPDAEEGFVNAVYNTQINLAMYYMIEIVAELQETISELENKSAKATKKTTTKKATAKTASEED